MHGKDGEDIGDLLGLESPSSTEMMPAEWYGNSSPGYFCRIGLGLLAIGAVLAIGLAATLHVRDRTSKQDSDFMGI